MRIIRKKNSLTLALFLCFCMGLTILSGCNEKKTTKSEYYLFYLNQQEDNIVPEAYTPQATDTESLVEEIATHIMDTPADADNRSILPDSVVLEKVDWENSCVNIYFNSAYLENLTADRELLCRGAIVHDMMQIDGVEGVYFYVDGEPLTDAKGNEVGKMTLDSFVENPGEELNSIQDVNLTLYFASEDGAGLVSEEQHVYYSSNISIEKLVMERLLEGPKSENAKASIPENTGLISVSVMDGVCFVNLDENFMNQDFEVSEDVVIYSIVDSLTALSSVDTVQISVSGNTNLIYRDKYDLNQYYEMDRSLITAQGENVEVNQQEGDADTIIDTEE